MLDMVTRKMLLVIFILLGTGSGTSDSLFKRVTDTEFECAWRAVAYDYGRALSPMQGSFQTLFDALQLDSCNKSLEHHFSIARIGKSFSTPSFGDRAIFVDFNQGSDRNTGAVDSPLKTLQAAVDLSRTFVQGSSKIVLRGGFFFFST
jgi:hypothetical protein